MPTILDLTGITLPRGIQGKSLQSLLFGQMGVETEFALVEHYASDIGFNIKTIRSNNWRFTYYGNLEYGELYDLNKDPNEFINLWNRYEYKDIKNKLMKTMLDIIISTEDVTLDRIKKY